MKFLIGVYHQDDPEEMLEGLRRSDAPSTESYRCLHKGLWNQYSRKIDVSSADEITSINNMAEYTFSSWCSLC
jgi:hypothetical protein